MIRNLHCVLIMTLPLAPLRAEEVFLKNGRIMKGKIITESDDEVVLDVGTGKAPIKRSDIERIEWGYDREALEELKPANAKEYMEHGSRLVQSEDEGVKKIGLRLLHLSSRLDKELYIPALLVLAKYEGMQKRGDPVRYYKRILMYQPGNGDARKKLDQWLEANPEKPTNTAEIRQTLLQGLKDMMAGNWDPAYEAFNRIPGLPAGEPIPLHISMLRSKTRNAARARLGKDRPFLSEEQLRKFRIYMLHLEATHYNPFDPPGEKLPKLGKMTWEGDVEYDRTVFKRGRFVRP